MTMVWCVVQYHIGTRSDEVAELMDWNRRICSKNRIEYRDLSEVTQLHALPPYWAKVRAVLTTMTTMTSDVSDDTSEISENLNRLDAVLWLDSDAGLTSHGALHLDSLFDSPDQFFAFAGDCPEWDSRFNAGVWAVRNSSQGRNLMEKWLSTFDTNSWTLQDEVNHKWTCNGPWAGNKYEQGSMKELLFGWHRTEEEKHLAEKEWSLLQSNLTHFRVGTDYIMTYHFAGPFKGQIRDALDMKMPHFPYFCQENGRVVIPDTDLGRLMKIIL